jgi:hypothetical protein
MNIWCFLSYGLQRRPTNLHLMYASLCLCENEHGLAEVVWGIEQAGCIWLHKPVLRPVCWDKWAPVFGEARCASD